MRTNQTTSRIAPVVTLCSISTQRVAVVQTAPKNAGVVWSATSFEMNGLRRILRVSWTAKKTNEWVLNKAGVKGELLDTVKARKLAYYGHTTRKQESCLEKEIMQGTMPDARRRGRPRTAWMDSIKTWTGLSVEESIRMTEDRDKGCGQPSDRGQLKP